MAAAGEENSADPAGRGSVATKDVDLVQQDPITAQHELLVTEIESSDGHLGTALRAVYDGEEPTKFMERLDLRIKSHDKEIERMCNFHYQGFIESIRGLLQVRSEAEKLKDEIQCINAALQRSGKTLLNKAQDLVTCRTTQKNIAAAIETLSLCLPVLETYGKLKDQMKSKRYYPALKTLEQLEHTYLPRVSKYRFSQAMCETIPKLRENIKEASMSDLKDFLENIRKHSDRIGEVAMRHAAEQHNMDPALAIKKKKKRKAPPAPNPFTGVLEVDDEDHFNPFEESRVDDLEEELSAQDLVDFSPVYRCLHIYSVLVVWHHYVLNQILLGTIERNTFENNSYLSWLVSQLRGARETFETYYRKQRRKQARLALQPPPNMSRKPGDDGRGLKERAKQAVKRTGMDPDPHETLEGYKKYFHDIVGFFVVEDHILNTTSGLVNRAYIDELWDMALSKIVAVLRTHSAFCTDPSLMLQIKNLIMLFCHTLRGYGFTVSQLYDLLLEIRDQYSEILMKKWVQVFNDIFEEDNYTAITVDSEQDYNAVTSVYPYQDDALRDAPFPKKFPFSHFVPKVYCQVKEYIYACLKFSEDLHLSQTEIDDMIRKLANVLLTRTLSGCLSALIRRPNLTLLQLIQISINMNELEKSCIYLEDFISNITGAQKDSIHVSKLQGISMFKDARSEAEGQIYKQMNQKIDCFLETADYDWMLAESKGHASSYITDIIAFLQSTFMAFTNLPDLVAQTACMSACKHIAAAMMEFLLDNEVRSLSMGVFQQFNLDLLQCEMFADSKPVPGFNEGTLQMAFDDLRQLLDLFLTWDWSTYLADYGHEKSKYLRVQPGTAITLLEKMKDADKKKNNLFTTFKRNERDKKKLLDTVLKQLRGLVNGTATHM